MKKLITLAVLVLVALGSYAQSGVYRYRFIHGIPDTLRRGIIPLEVVFDSDVSLEVESFKIASQTGYDSTIRSRPIFNTKGFEPALYKNIKLGTYQERRKVLSGCIEADTLPAINWILFNDKKTIAGYTCYRAEAQVRGRHFTVWYTPQIPISGGPWKLHGLPGFILSGTDKERKVIFEFDSIDIVDGKNLSISTLTSQCMLTHLAFKKKLVTRFENAAKIEGPPQSGVSARQLSCHTIDMEVVVNY
jgi:GLPGLI family protein